MPRARVRSPEPGFVLGEGSGESREAGQEDPGEGAPHNRDVELMDWDLVWAEVPYVEAYGGPGGPSDSGRWEQVTEVDKKLAAPDCVCVSDVGESQ